jgi:hypothetical protein
MRNLDCRTEGELGEKAGGKIDVDMTDKNRDMIGHITLLIGAR